MNISELETIAEQLTAAIGQVGPGHDSPSPAYLEDRDRYRQAGVAIRTAFHIGAGHIDAAGKVTF